MLNLLSTSWERGNKVSLNEPGNIDRGTLRTRQQRTPTKTSPGNIRVCSTTYNVVELYIIKEQQQTLFKFAQKVKNLLSWSHFCNLQEINVPNCKTHLKLGSFLNPLVWPHCKIWKNWKKWNCFLSDVFVGAVVLEDEISSRSSGRVWGVWTPY